MVHFLSALMFIHYFLFVERKLVRPSCRLNLTGQYDVKISFLEIYNETIRDLLRDPNNPEKKHEIKVSQSGQRIMTDLTVQPLNLEDDDVITDLLSLTAKHRSVASTNMNDVSSRSHSVFTLYLTAKHE